MPRNGLLFKISWIRILFQMCMYIYIYVCVGVYMDTYICVCVSATTYVYIRANPSVCPRRRRRHVRTSKNTVFCGTKCTCPWSWLSSCNTQLSYLCVECYNNIIIIINIIIISSSSITIIIIMFIFIFIIFILIFIFPIECKVERGWEFTFLIPLLVFPIECKV